MAGDWIKMSKDLANKPEVRRLARLLNVTRFDIVGRLQAVWSWADTHSFTGSNMDITEDDIDDIADLSGFAAGLRQVGWLRGRAAALEFPNFDRHNGQTAKTRAMNQQRQEKCRSRKSMSYANGRDKCHGEAVTGALPEKRREDIIESIPTRDDNTLGAVEAVQENARESDLAGFAGLDAGEQYPERLNEVRGVRRATMGSKEFLDFMLACLEVHPSWGKLPPSSGESGAALECYNLVRGRVTRRDLELLRAYYADDMAEDRRGRRFWRPESKAQFFQKFSDVLVHAERWAKETRWKPRKERARAKVVECSQDGSKGPCMSISDALAGIAEAKRQFGF